jgi:hypothetical protein
MEYITERGKDTDISIAIIVPYRNRVNHLVKFLKHITNFDIYIIEQNNYDKFNRGLLLNIGYIIASRKKKYDRYIFHDVDSYPDSVLLSLYKQYPERNIHFASNEYKYNYPTFMGGVLGMKGTDFEKINGFPNTFFGWGGEDDALYNRIIKNKITVYKQKIGKYFLEEHREPKKEEYNDKKKRDIYNDLKNWKNDGLKQLLNFFINVKAQRSLEEFLKIDSNFLDSILLSDYKDINYFFYKIDYLSLHTKEKDTLILKNEITDKINKKLKEGMIQSEINPIYLSYIQPLITMNEIEKKIFKTYSKPKKFTQKPIGEICELVKKQFYETSLEKEDLFNTIKFLFETYTEFLYFRIRNNKLECAYHLYNPVIKMDWYKYLKYNSMNIDETLLEVISKKTEYFTVLKPNFNSANNCLLHLEAYQYLEGNPYAYVKEFNEIINYTIDTFKDVPDSDILINRRDFPFLRKDKKFAYTHLTSEKVPLEKSWYVCSQSKTKDNLDILIPSADEWKNCESNIKETEWKDKKPIAFFRGSSTGCGVRIDNNPRLKLAKIATKNKNLLNVAITNLVIRIKAYNKFIGIIDRRKLNYLRGDFIDNDEQAKYKYIFNIQGNSQAYRYSTEFKKKSVILNVKSEYYMWFESLLKDKKNIVEIESNYSNLFSTIKWLKNNDSKAKKIAEEGYIFSKKYINKEIIAEYFFNVMYFINNNI